MATKRKSSGRSGESGSTLYGALAGLLIGLIVAAVVAFYVTKAPVPFVDRASRDAGKLPDPRQAPDPNAGLYGRDGAAGTPPSGPTATTPAPLPGTARRRRYAAVQVRRPGRADRHVADLQQQPAAAVCANSRRAQSAAHADRQGRADASPAPKASARRHRRPPRHRPTAPTICRPAPSAAPTTPNRSRPASSCWACRCRCRRPKSTARR